MTNKIRISVQVFLLFTLLFTLPAYGQVERAGSVYLSTDGGQVWSKMNKGLPGGVVVNDFAANGSFLVAATEAHGVYLSDNQAGQWRASTAGLPANLKVNAVELLGEYILIGTYQHGVYVSADKGRSWTASNTGLSSKDVRRMYIYEGKIYLGTAGGLFTSVDAGKSWTKTYDKMQISGLTVLGRDIYAGGEKGIVMSSDFGKTWKAVLEGKALHNVSSDGMYVYAMTYKNGLLRKKVGASEWENAGTGLPPYYTYQVLSDGTDVLAGQVSGVFRSSDHGSSWAPLSLSFPAETSVKELIQTDFGLVAGTVKIVKD